MDSSSSDPYFFLSSVEPWSLSQVYLPFALFLFTHNVWFTLSCVFLSKFILAAVYLFLGGFMLIGFGGDYNSMNDTRVVDPLGALLGIFLAWFITHLFQAARIISVPWTWANFKLHAGYYIRNVVGLLAMMIFSLVINFNYHTQVGQCGTPLGIVVYLTAGFVIIISLFYLNRNTSDLQWVWSHPPVAKRFSLRTRYNATYGLWLLAHCGSCLCFMCTWSSGFGMALATTIALLAFSTLTWFVVDARYRKGEGEQFSLMNLFRCFASQSGPLGTVTSETLAIPGPGSYSAIPSLRSEPPMFILVDRPDNSVAKDTGANPSSILSSGVLLQAQRNQLNSPVMPSPGSAQL